MLYYESFQTYIKEENVYNESSYLRPNYTMNIGLFLLYHVIYPSWEIPLKCKSHYVVLLHKNLPKLPFSLRVKVKPL